MQKNYSDGLHNFPDTFLWAMFAQWLYISTAVSILSLGESKDNYVNFAITKSIVNSFFIKVLRAVI